MMAALLSFGGLIAFAVVVLAWLFRSTTAPIWLKIVASSVAVVSACASVYGANSMLGYPMIARMADLPDNATLVAFVPHDEAKYVDLWLLSGTETPRAYETALDARMKETLRQAQQAMEKGERAVLSKRAEKPTGDNGRQGGGDRLGIGDDSTFYILDPDATSRLPAKD